MWYDYMPQVFNFLVVEITLRRFQLQSGISQSTNRLMQEIEMILKGF